VALVLPVILLATAAGTASAQDVPDPHFAYATAQIDPTGNLVVAFKLAGYGNASSGSVGVITQGVTAVWLDQDGNQVTTHTDFFEVTYIYCNEISGCDSTLSKGKLIGSITLPLVDIFRRPGTLLSVSYAGLKIWSDIAYSDGTHIISNGAVTPSSVTWP